MGLTGSLVRQTWRAAAAALSILPLISLFGHPEIGAPIKTLIVTLAAVSAASPEAGLYAEIVLLPLALAIEILISPFPDAAAITEALVLAFLAGASWRLVGTTAGEREWLGRPALVFGCLIAASAIVDLAGVQAGAPSRAVASEVWHHVTRDYFMTTRPFVEFHATVRWLADLALAVFAERTIRRRAGARTIAVRLWLIGAAASAAFAAIRLADILLRNRGHEWSMFAYVLTNVRITALFPDVNAAGSYFALPLVAALVLGVAWRKPWILALIVPPVALAFVLAQSRAAILAVVVVLALAMLAPVIRARRPLLTAVVAAAMLLALVAGVQASRRVMASSHVAFRQAADIRTQMAQVALQITRDHPVFGIGVGRYVEVSRRYISPHLAALRAFAPAGENAHNNFLQVLADLGAPGLVLFCWIVVPASLPPRRTGEAARRDDRQMAAALSAGLAAFLLSALFGHPLLIAQVAAAFFLALGLAGGLRPAPRGAGVVSRIVCWAGVTLLAVTLPWRLWAQLKPAPGDVQGVGAVAGTLDGVEYSPAQSGARWLVTPRAIGLDLPVRWAAGAATDCALDVLFDGRQADEIHPVGDAWISIDFELPSPPPGMPWRPLEVRIPNGQCQLLVGALQVRR